MAEARKLYMMVVLPVITYLASAWFSPLAKRQPRLLHELQITQNSCLRQVLGAYKATPTSALHTMAHVPPLNLILTQRVIAASARLRQHRTTIQSACNRISRTFKISAPYSQVIGPKPLADDWPLECGLRLNNDTGNVWDFDKPKLHEVTGYRWHCKFLSVIFFFLFFTFVNSAVTLTSLLLRSHNPWEIRE